MMDKARPTLSRPTVSCSACDADFPPEPNAARVACPRCGALNDVPPFMRDLQPSPGETEDALDRAQRTWKQAPGRAAPAATSRGMPRVICEGCNVALAFDGVQAQLTCGFCGRTQDVPPFVLDAAKAYVAKMKVLWGDALEAQYIRLMHAHASHYQLPILFAIAGVILFSTSSFIPVTVRGTHLPLWVDVAWVGAGIGSWTWFVHCMREMMRPPSVSLVLSSGLGECRTCGAPVNVAEGRASVACEHCGATSLSSAPLRTQAIRAAGKRVHVQVDERDTAIAANWRAAGYSQSGGGGCAMLILLGACFTWMFAFPAAALLLESGFRGNTPNGWAFPSLVLGYGLATAALVHGFKRANRAKLEMERVIGREMKPPAHAVQPPQRR